MDCPSFPDERNPSPFAGCLDRRGPSWIACRAVKGPLDSMAAGYCLDLGNILIGGGEYVIDQTELFCQFNTGARAFQCR